VEIEITPRARQQLHANQGSWLGTVLEPLGTNFTRRGITLDLQREAIAASVLTDVAGAIRILSPATLR
jgi:hypothetical protein